MSNEVEFSEFIVQEIDAFYGDEKAEIFFEHNGKHIVLSALASLEEPGDTRKRTCVEDRFIGLLSQAADGDLNFYEPEDKTYYESLVDEVVEIIADLGRLPLAQVAPPLTVPFSPPRDLHYQLYPQTFYFRLQTIHDAAFFLPISSREAVTARDDTGPDPNFKAKFKPDPTLPRYSSRDIIVEKQYRGGIGVMKVRIESQVMLCKSFQKGLEHSYLEQELINLDRVSKAFSEIRIPTIKGYVTHAENGAIVGLLRDWIPRSRYGNTLQDAGRCMNSIPVPVRRKWLKQITETINALHGAGLLWGDVKASNVCIDMDDNLWLIDFAGGWTQAWVNKDIAGTIEGDKHGLMKLKAFMGFKCPEVSTEELRRLLSGFDSSSSI